LALTDEALSNGLWCSFKSGFHISIIWHSSNAAIGIETFIVVNTVLAEFLF